MGLADEKLKRGVQDYITRAEKNLAEKKMPMKFVVAWDTFGAITKENTDRTEGVCSQVSGKFGNFLLNYDNADYKALVDAINTSFSTFKIVHAPTGKKFEYKLEIADKTCTFTADMSQFTFSSSSSDDQPGIRDYLEKIL